MYLCSSCDNLEVFNTDSIKELINFKWIEFGQSHHMIGLFFHTCQMIMVMIYIQYVYIDDSFDIYKPGSEPTDISHPQSVFAFILFICLIYPTIYEGLRMKNQGLLGYFQLLSNYGELLYVIFSIVMTIVHILTPPQFFVPKLLMIIVIALAIIRTFK